MNSIAPIGIFDSGFGGLTVMREIVNLLPEYDYCYLGDNARAPYGTRTFSTVYKYTREAVNWLFAQNCHLIIIACNTASAKALRTIQQRDLSCLTPDKRVLGVIRPLTERAGELTKTGHIGLLATAGTVRSCSYSIEIKKFYPHINLTEEACPLWVPLIENMELDNEGTGFFVKRHINNLLKRDNMIDSIILGCTHYPLLQPIIERFVSRKIRIVNQGKIVSEQLKDYLNRHAEIDMLCTKNNSREFYTTDLPEAFDVAASYFYGSEVHSTQVDIS